MVKKILLPLIQNYDKQIKCVISSKFFNGGVNGITLILKIIQKQKEMLMISKSKSED